MDRRFAGAIVGVRMADAGGFDANQNIMCPGYGDGNIVGFKRAALLNQADGFHVIQDAARQESWRELSAKKKNSH